MATPAKGKAKVKVTSTGKKVSYGQAGQASGGGARVKPGTKKGDAYCARSAGQMKKNPKKILYITNTTQTTLMVCWVIGSPWVLTAL